ncbi:hypothetical protein BC826DRAFT_1107786 [Russula brevipes]|nr:hypothetical protein BC826DRAFT_1107786 [Russula brevipes]
MPSTPALQDLSTTTTPQAQETVNAATNTAAVATHKSNADNPQASNVPDPPPANASTLQDLGTRKNKKATPSTPAPQDLSTTTTPQAQETVNAATNAAAVTTHKSNTDNPQASNVSDPPPASRQHQHASRPWHPQKQESNAVNASTSNANNPQASNVPDPPPTNASALQDLGTRKNKKATPSMPALQDLSTSITPQAQETVNAATNAAAAADINTTNNPHRRPQHPQRQSPKFKSDAATGTSLHLSAA